MIDKSTAYRIADAITALRPTWNRNQIVSVLGNPAIKERRDPRDTAAALAWLALDTETRQPTRLLEAGEWWGTGEAHTTIRPALPPHADDCLHCGQPPTGTHANHAYEPRIPFVGDRPGAPCPDWVKQAALTPPTTAQPATTATKQPLSRPNRPNAGSGTTTTTSTPTTDRSTT